MPSFPPTVVRLDHAIASLFHTPHHMTTTMATPNKIKILLVGPIGDNVDDFISKISTLQKSKAGPFDACFCVGPVHSSITQQKQLPLPVYLQNASGLTEEKGLVEIAPNLYTFATAQVVSLDIAGIQLVVASCPPRLFWDSDASQQLRETVSHVSYVGCDLLLSEEWPQGIETTLEGMSGDDEGSFDVAQVALQARPRYHVAPAHGSFLQSPPFCQLASTSSTFTPKHAGRFLCLNPVVSPAALKEKGKTAKFVHALGITPLQYMTAIELQMPQGVLPNPYTDDSYQTTIGGAAASVGTSSFTTTNSNVGLSEAQARRLLSESTSNAAGGDSHARWVTSSKKRTRDSATQEVDNSNNTTLFLYGLHKDVRGVLQTGSAALLQAFGKFQLSKIRRPPGTSSFAFLEFPSHELARACLETLGGETTVAGIHLTLKWATAAGGNHTTNKQSAPKKQRLMESDAMDSSTVYYRLPSKILTEEFAATCEQLRVLCESFLEKALADPHVTAKTEPALQVKIRMVGDDKNFGFLEFASHAAGSMALATMTGSTDGGMVVVQDEESQTVVVPPNLLGVLLHWAHNAKPAFSSDESGGLKFKRKHFPADSRKDCWFCLASPTCEKHLVVSVHDECYIAMPKGPVHPQGHVLIIPVTHSGKGALVDQCVAGEMEELKTRLRQHASEKYNCDLYVFERAIQTKGGYHTHVQCIPIARGLGMKLQATIMAMARSIPGFDLKELNSDLALSAMASNDDDDEDGGYFYAEVPISSKEVKRFLYKAKPNVGAVVPLQFGREVLAQVLDQPDLAHWKACVQNEEKETELTAAFRESFAPFSPVDQEE